MSQIAGIVATEYPHHIVVKVGLGKATMQANCHSEKATKNLILQDIGFFTPVGRSE